MQWVIKLDDRLTYWVQNWPSGWHDLMFVVTQLGSVAVIITASLAIAVFAWFKRRYGVMVGFLAVIAVEVLNALLKLILRRARPVTPFAANMSVHTFSFPSGHSVGATVFYGLLAYLAYTRLPPYWGFFAAVGLGILILLIGVSRVYLGAHFALDVVAGWVIGGIALAIIIRLIGQ